MQFPISAHQRQLVNRLLLSFPQKHTAYSEKGWVFFRNRQYAFMKQAVPPQCIGVLTLKTLNELRLIKNLYVCLCEIKTYNVFMEELPVIDFENLRANLTSYDCFQNDILVSDLDYHSVFSTNCVRMNALQIVLLLQGSLELNIDYTSYTVTANSMTTIMPTHVVQMNRFSSDFKARLLVVSRSFLEQTVMPGQSSSMIKYMSIRKNPCALLQAGEVKILDDYLLLLRNKIRLHTHNLHRLMIQNTLIGFFIEIGNIFYDRQEYTTSPTLTRKEELLEAFLKLLFIHCKEQHVVSFYAEKLYITPQYLSLILKEQTGKSANKWIDEALMQEAKILLKAPQSTVQQVADTLHFSDQSTFGKFFKKHMGMSPMEYRKSS